ncbi:MAG TPA: copper chaperone [bacterium]|nr:copper chaperone [bacterium]
MEEKTVVIPNISCGHCIMTIKNELGNIEGVESVEGNPATKNVTITWQSPANWEKIVQTLNEIGYMQE